MSDTGEIVIEPMDTAEAPSNKKSKKLKNKKGKVRFSALKKSDHKSDEVRKIVIPTNRIKPLKEVLRNQDKLFSTLVHLGLKWKMFSDSRTFVIKKDKSCKDSSNLQKAADCLQAFCCGFNYEDALALVRLDDIYMETFDVRDVKLTLENDSLSRAIGRMCGKNGKTKHTIENATRTRIVVADSKVHLLGTYATIAIARKAICNLILGSPPSKVFGRLKSIADNALEKKY